jgi:hypothetical protein
MKKYIRIIKDFIREIIAGKHGNFDIYKFISLLPNNFFRGLFWRIWISCDHDRAVKWYCSKRRNTYLVFGSLLCTAHGIDDNIWKQQCADLDRIMVYPV